MFDPVTMLAAFAPTLVKVFDAAIQRYVLPDKFKPSSIAEVAQLAALENDKLKMLLDADKTGDTYKWVEAIRKLQRPVVVFATLTAFLHSPDTAIFGDLFQVVMWYLFGERFLVRQSGVNK